MTLMDEMFPERSEMPDRDVGGVEFTREELATLLGMFQGPAYELYCRILNQMQDTDVDAVMGTNEATEMEGMYRAKGAFLAIRDLKVIPARAQEVFNALQQPESS
jgi:hypothetical protein